MGTVETNAFKTFNEILTKTTTINKRVARVHSVTKSVTTEVRREVSSAAKKEAIHADGDTQKVIGKSRTVGSTIATAAASIYTYNQAVKGAANLQNAVLSSSGQYALQAINTVNIGNNTTKAVAGFDTKLVVEHIKNIRYTDLASSIHSATQNFIGVNNRADKLVEHKRIGNQISKMAFGKGTYSSIGKIGENGKLLNDDLVLKKVKELKKLSQKATNASVLYKSKWRAPIKGFRKSAFTLVTSPIMNSEAGKGISIGRSLVTPIRYATKVTYRAVEKTVYHTIRRANIISMKANGMAKEDIARVLSKNGLTKRTPKNFIKNKIIRSIKPLNAISQRKAAKINAKVAKKVAKKAARQAVKKQAAQAVKKGIKSIGKAIFEAIKALVRAIASLGAPIVVPIILVLLIIVIIGVLLGGMKENSDTKKKYIEGGYFAVGDYIMEELQEKHNSLITASDIIDEKYDAAEVQFPNGTSENYKEIICAVFVAIDGRFDDVSEEMLKNLVDQFYDATHHIEYVEYEFSDPSDTSVTRTGKQVYISIDREDTLCYELFSQNAADEVAEADVGTATIKAVAEPGNWLGVCQVVKSAVSDAAKMYPNNKGVMSYYSQEHYCKIEINGKTYTVRQDCSGYVHACVQVYYDINVGTETEIIPDSSDYPSFGTSADAVSLYNSSYELPGFKKVKWTGWSGLQPGDIIAYRHWDAKAQKTIGHIEIFVCRKQGQSGGYVFSNGSSSGVNSKIPEQDTKTYTAVFRPLNPGELANLNTDVETVEDDTTETAENLLTAEELEDDFDVSKYITASNTATIVWNEKTENESGYSGGLTATVKALQNGDDYTDDTWTSNDGFKGYTDTRTSFDFVKEVCASHGVNIGVKNIDAFDLYKQYYSLSSYRAGDIILYYPYETIDSDVSSIVGKTKTGLYDVAYTDDEDSSDEDSEEEPSNGNLYEASSNTTDDNISGTYNTEAMNKFILLIDIGNNKFAYFGPDLTETYSSSEYDSAEKAVRTISASKLDSNRIASIARPTHYTKNKIYKTSLENDNGLQFFVGWTDMNIYYFLKLYNAVYWDGYTHEMISDLAGGDDEKNTTITVDYTFYDPEFELGSVGNDYAVSDDYADSFADEIMLSAIQEYDISGLYPSTVYKMAYFLGHKGASFQTVKGNNLFGAYESTNGSESISVAAFSYEVTNPDQTGTGNANTISDKLYATYSTYNKAIDDFVKYIKEKTNDSKYNKIMNADDGDEQLELLVKYGIVSDLALDDANIDTNISTKTYSRYDACAVEYGEAIADYKEKMSELSKIRQSNYYSYKNGSSFVIKYDGNGNLICPFTAKEYSEYVEAVETAQELQEKIISMSSSSTKIKSSASKSKVELTSRIKTLIKSNNYLLDADIDNVNEMYEYSTRHPFIIGYTCGGHEEYYYCKGHKVITGYDFSAGPPRPIYEYDYHYEEYGVLKTKRFKVLQLDTSNYYFTNPNVNVLEVVNSNGSVTTKEICDNYSEPVASHNEDGVEYYTSKEILEKMGCTNIKPLKGTLTKPELEKADIDDFLEIKTRK